MVAYAPFDSEEPPSHVPGPVVNLSRVDDRRLVLGGPDVTECNYLILFFVIGIFLLTLVDALRK
jgi:hypothetical protein